jgi:hypothetical protein
VDGKERLNVGLKPLEARWYLSLAGHEIGGGTGGITEAYDVICICQDSPTTTPKAEALLLILANTNQH